MSMTSGSDERLIPKNEIDSPVIDDANHRENVGANGPLRKGPSAEDAILVEYVKKHGEGNWNAVQKNLGLARCGKSCRLRWPNHLRPDLKKGAFSPEEELLIIELHAKMGNKWARMAAELPGRTDNEIKNYWYMRIKRRQRVGLPIYQPDDYNMQAFRENQTDDMPTLSTGDAQYPNSMPANKFVVPLVEDNTLELNHPLYPPPPHLTVPTSTLLAQGLHSEPLFSHSNAAMNNGSVQIARSSAYDHSSTCNQALSASSVLCGSHAGLNGNPSSEPTWAMKLELPSFQNQMGSSSWVTPSSQLPSLESVDLLIQSPQYEKTLLYNPSPRNSGLLDAILYESQTKNSCSSCGPNVLTSPEPISPFGNSSSSSFSDSTPISRNSFDEPESVQPVPIHYGDKDDEATHGYEILSRPDLMLGATGFAPRQPFQRCNRDGS